MANITVPTLLDIAIANGSDQVVGLIEETIKAVPEVLRGAARTIKGVNYKTLVRTKLPQVGFRRANEGAIVDKGTYENRLYEAYIFNPRWEADKAVCDSHEDGAAAFISIEASGIMEAAFQTLGAQFYYGVGNDVKGFPGILAAIDPSLVVDATGTSVGAATSVYAVRFGPKDVQWLYGLNGSLSLSPLQEQRVLDASGNPYTAYVQEITARPGLQVGRKYSVGRIKNLTTQNGKGLTDALLSQLLGKFPVGLKPDYFFMSRQSLQQLQSSRTATNATGAPAPIPDAAFGIPILPTDSISNTEALA